MFLFLYTRPDVANVESISRENPLGGADTKSANIFFNLYIYPLY